MSGVGAPQGGGVEPVDRFIDIHKFMTTIGAGAVVLIATFMKDIFPKSATGGLLLEGWNKMMLGVAMASFGVAVFVSVTGLFFALIVSSRESGSNTLSRGAVARITFVVVYAFAFGITAFAYVVFSTVIM